MLSRRDALKLTAASVAAPIFVPREVFGLGAVAPSNRITMGLIGCGGMGRANLNGFMRRPGVEILAVCDPDRERRDVTARSVEAHGREHSETGSARRCDTYNDYRELLARDDIDAVIIASPDHWHALHVVHAARAGKDIYGEKPLSLTVRQGRVMSDTVRRFGRVFQTGSQQRSDGRFQQACELVRSGALGRIERVTCGLPKGRALENQPRVPVPDGFDYDLWLGPAPAAPYCDRRTHYDFRNILDYSGGQLTDWAAHHVDIAQWALGEAESGPVEVEGAGEFPRDGLWDAAVQYDIRCRYRSGVELLVTSRFENGVLFEGTDGRVFVNRGRIEANPASLLEIEFSPAVRQLPATRDHRGDFLECLRTRRDPIAPIEHAHRSITVAHLGNIAMQTGKPLRWNPETESIESDSIAARLLDRPLRGQWSLA